MHLGIFRVDHILIIDAISLEFSAKKIPFDLFVLKHFCQQHVSLFCILSCTEEQKKINKMNK